MSSFRYLAIFGSILHIFNALLFLLDRPKAYPRSDRKTPVFVSKVVFCRVCISGYGCIPHTSSGYGYGSLAELTEVSGRFTNVVIVALPAPGFFLQEHTRSPGIVPRAYRTYRSSGYGYECRTELTKVPGTGNTPRMVLYVPYRTQHFHLHTEVPGTGMEILQNSRKFWLQVWTSYRTHRSSG